MSSDTKFRIEKDSIGEIRVPSNKYWGAQTQRSLMNFAIGDELMPFEVIEAIALIKKAAAIVNMRSEILSSDKGKLIVRAADEILSGKHNDAFPLKVWQTGSGTQSNMNVNEVIAHIAEWYASDSSIKIHPNDDVNKGQSSNDVFPTAMNIASVKVLMRDFIPSINTLRNALDLKCAEFKDVIKIARTHMQDAVPMTFGQEFSAYVYQIDEAMELLSNVMPALLNLAQGATAVGTGLNASKDFGELIAKEIAKITGYDFKSAKNKFAALACNDSIVAVSGVLNVFAVALHKIANDIRLLGSGPRCGIGELILPANEPGSSIMPGKVNPTQCEALTMVCAQVIGNHATITFAGSQGHLQLNVYKPVMIYNLLQSVKLLGDAVRSFAEHCVNGLTINTKKVQNFVDISLMNVTGLSKEIGYDDAARVAKYAHDHDIKLREAALSMKVIDAQRFDELIDPRKMI